ncbi:MAG: hypothetical protein LJE95_04030 [Acidobacteria bacterium]|nr:hypothetical protein [Acidobacteriota bacterium]
MSRGDLLLLFKEISLTLRLVLVLPWIGAAAAVVVAVSPRTWRREPQQGLRDRLVPRLAALASLLLLVQVLYWRLLPW